MFLPLISLKSTSGLFFINLPLCVTPPSEYCPLSNNAFNYDFRLYLEGVLTPFKSAQILAYPNGVETHINILSNIHVYDIKPKTGVQIFYKDWVKGKAGKYGWRLLYDGFVSGVFSRAVARRVAGSRVQECWRQHRQLAAADGGSSQHDR